MATTVLADPKTVLLKVVQERAPAGTLLLGYLSGSHGYNLNTATSDLDFFGVYAAPVEECLSYLGTKETLDRSGPDCPEDYCVYEAKKYCELLLKGNPKVIEPMFSQAHAAYWSPEFAALVEKRKIFLNRVTLDQYIGYTKEKLHSAKKPLSDKNDPKKHMYHALRLATEALRIAKGGEPLVFLTGEEREKIMAIRRGERNLEEVKAVVLGLLDECLALRDSLPAQADPLVLSEWLMNIRGVKRVPRPLVIPPPSGLPKLVERTKNLLEKWGVTGEVIFCGVSGSSLHGFTPVSDASDAIAIWAQPPERAFELGELPEVLSETSGVSTQTTIPGLIAFELKAAVCAMLAGNARMMEVLFNTDASKVAISSKVWQELVEMKDKFLGKSFMAHCVGLAEGQSKAAENPLASASATPQQVKDAVKKVAHAVRIASYAHSFMKGEVPKFSWASIAPGTLEARVGKILADGDLACAKEELANLKKQLPELKAAEKATPLPPADRKAFVMAWFLSQRMGALPK